MKLENENFPVYMDTEVIHIPTGHLTPMLMELVTNALFYMNTENNAETTLRMVSGIRDLLLTDHSYKHFKLHLIIETFHKGSLGELGGTTKFGLRNVNIWLFSVKDKAQKLDAERRSREDNNRKAEEERAFRSRRDRNTLYGAAMYRKIEWASAGHLTDRQYDLCTLDKIVELLERGYSISDLQPGMIVS